MDIPRNWRLRDQRYRLQGTRCASCGAHHFPPRPVCPRCRGRHVEPYRFTGRGRVYSYTVVYQAPEGFEQYVPYVVALVDLEEGVRVTAQLTDVDPEEVAIGMPVEMVLRKLGEEGERGLILYGYKFRPRIGDPKGEAESD
ncbi:MAG: Zn-ribbon domain-containing OB-fold protein [Ardenticatenia bacterium]|nr:Zn-ribbon domain-containing OB-fold protein [Ardenticatenia bacterium]